MSESREIQTQNPSSAASAARGAGTELAARQPVVRKPYYTSRYDENSWQVHVHLPGVAKSDTKVTVENEILEVRAMRRLSAPEGWRPLGAYPEAKHYHLRLDIGPEVDAAGITASQADGVLSMSLPLREEVKPRRIEIQ